MIYMRAICWHASTHRRVTHNSIPARRSLRRRYRPVCAQNCPIRAKIVQALSTKIGDSSCKALFDEMRVGIMLINERFRIVYANPEAARLLISPASQLLGQNILQTAWASPALVKALSDPGQSPTEIVLEDGAGGHRLQASVLRLRQCVGRMRGRLICLQELTEGNLRQAHAELNAVFQALPDLYFRVAGDGTILDYRTGRVDDLYVPPEQFLGRRISEVLPADISSRLMEALQQALLTGQVVRLEYELPMPNGTRYYEARLSSCLPNQAIALIRNITDYRLAYAALQEAQERLEARVAERTAELMQLNQRLSQEIVKRQRVEAELRALNANLEHRVNDRTRKLAALYQISAAATRAGSLDVFLNETLAQAATALSSDAGIIVLLETEDKPVSLFQWHLADHQAFFSALLRSDKLLSTEDNLLTTILKSPSPLLIPDMTDDPRVPAPMRTGVAKTLLAGSIQANGQVLGAICLAREAARAYNTEEIALLAAIADQIGVTVWGDRMRQAVQEAILLNERQRLARELHNSVIQNLYGLVAFSETARAQLGSGDFTGISAILERIDAIARQALREMRLFIYQLRPGTLEREGLVAALRLRLAAVEGHADIRAELLADENIKLTLPVERALYQVAQEALNNVLRHAHATSVTVALHRVDSEVILEVTDNGCGFEALSVGCGGIGLAAMREAMKDVGGNLEIVSAKGTGTTVRATVKT